MTYLELVMILQKNDHQQDHLAVGLTYRKDEHYHIQYFHPEVGRGEFIVSSKKLPVVVEQIFIQNRLPICIMDWPTIRHTLDLSYKRRDISCYEISFMASVLRLPRELDQLLSPHIPYEDLCYMHIAEQVYHAGHLIRKQWSEQMDIQIV